MLKIQKMLQYNVVSRNQNGGNTMFTLPWTAKFRDGSIIEQYENVFDGSYSKENTFKEVLNNIDDLELFYLINSNSGEVFAVDLINGCVCKTTTDSTMLEPRADMLRKHNLKYRLIYFREVERIMNMQLQEIGDPKIIYFLGFQYLDANGFNHKRIMKICTDGRWVCN